MIKEGKIVNADLQLLIYPYWNVNTQINHLPSTICLLLIYPYWNVNPSSGKGVIS